MKIIVSSSNQIPLSFTGTVEFPTGWQSEYIAGQIQKSFDNLGNFCTYKKGVLHSFDGNPGMVLPIGKFWYKDGEFHRDDEDKPAIELAYGGKLWYVEGVFLKKQNTRNTDGPKSYSESELNIPTWSWNQLIEKR